MDNFQPEYIEADEVIQVDGNYYGIFNVSGPDYSLPLIVFVDSLNYFNNGQPPANVPSFTKEQWEEDNQRLFFNLAIIGSIYSQLSGRFHKEFQNHH